MEEIEKHHRKLTLLAATGMMFLLLLGVLSNSTPLGGQFSEHLHTGVSPSEPVLVATANESASDLAQQSPNATNR